MNLIKQTILGTVLSVITVAALAQTAQTPTQALQTAVDGLIAVIVNEEMSPEQKKDSMKSIVQKHADFTAMSQRIVARDWRKADPKEKEEFTGLFTQVVVNTYFGLLEKYSGESVEYLKEQIKKKKYAVVDTHILSQGKKIPVKFRMILRKDEWRIYDYVVEGISMVSSYNGSYKPILKRGGLKALNESLTQELASI